ncbi:hypothetical protein [[Mycoplasma] gypis]|uniref:Uncharacterized protein n=1 Tax=[Mycoplasma] gypis TaxID=92404 RepID=A0ABZ2RNN4_9BACT|nr:hypothetical protein [[Mycoplasma] gypis]MBN0919436.1 hypothetical protein [[Mycoplasma] gypis]
MELNGFQKNLVLTINGDSQWAFGGVVSFDFHAFNFSKITINNVIHKSVLQNNKHLDVTEFLTKIDNYSIATLSSNGRVFFTGIITSIGRISLKPNTLKDFSIEISDIRLWLSKKTPNNIQFVDVTPTEALNLFIKGLNEKKIKLGSVNFTDNTKIVAYDTANKNAYSILKEVIANQTRSFLYFSSNNSGDVLINFMSQQNYENKKKTAKVLNAITPQTVNHLKITDIRLDKNADSYANRLYFESENIIYNQPATETFILQGSQDEYILKNTIGKHNPNPLLNFFYETTNNQKPTPLIVLDANQKAQGLDCHFYYEPNSNKIKKSKNWDVANAFVSFSYYPKGRFGVILENTQEIDKIKQLTNFGGDVFLYDKYNDYSNYDDLYKFTNSELLKVSTFANTLEIDTNKASWNISDVIYLNYSIQADGFYICIGYRGTYNQASDELKITYIFKNSINADTLLNFYDSQAFRDKPLFANKQTFTKSIETSADGNIWHIKTLNNQPTHQPTLVTNSIKLNTKLPYLFNFNSQKMKLKSRQKNKTIITIK